MNRIQILYLFLSIAGYLLAFLLVNPWFLLISLYLAPACRFGSFKSFSLGTYDFTFNTEDGGLHMAGGTFLYFLISPILLPVMLLRTLRSKP